MFLLSRIKEHYDLTRDNEEAIATGMQLTRDGSSPRSRSCSSSCSRRSSIGEVAVVKLFGLGLALAIVVDAFIIRVTLAPALMRIAGHLNWWAPRALRRLHLRFGVWESDALQILDKPTSDTGRGTMAQTRRSRKPNAPVAQWIEHLVPDPGAAGSNPAGRAQDEKHRTKKP